MFRSPRSSRFRCFAIALACIGAGLGSAVPAAELEWIYFNENAAQQLFRARPDGSGLHLVMPDLGVCGNLALDPWAGKVYWLGTDGNASVIRRAGLDGAGREILLTIAPNHDFTSGLAVDGEAGYVFWGQYWNPRIARANLDGSGVVTLRSWGHAGPGDLAIDPVRRHVYWGDWVNHEIRRCDYDGTNETRIVDAPDIPFQIALDLLRGHLYWSEYTLSGGPHIYRASLDGMYVTEFSRGERAEELMLDAEGGGLYAIQKDQARILRFSLDGAAVQTILEDLDDPWHGALLLQRGPIGVEETSWAKSRARFRHGGP